MPLGARAGPADLAALCRAHLGPLLRLAHVLSGHPEQAEDAVAEAFARVFPRWRRCRHLEVREERRRSAAGRATTGADDHLPDRDVVTAALRRLPMGQRVVLALRFYEDLSEGRGGRARPERRDCRVPDRLGPGPAAPRTADRVVVPEDMAAAVDRRVARRRRQAGANSLAVAAVVSAALGVTAVAVRDGGREAIRPSPTTSRAGGSRCPTPPSSAASVPGWCGPARR